MNMKPVFPLIQIGLTNINIFCLTLYSITINY